MTTAQHEIVRFTRTIVIFVSVPWSAFAQGDDEKKKEEEQNVIFSAGFQGEGVRVGNVPSSFDVVAGKWEIVELREGKPFVESDADAEEDDEKKKKSKGIESGAFQLLPEPVVDAKVQLGPFVADEGGEIVARVRAEEGTRISPRFGVGLHGEQGYRLRVVPAKGHIELQKGGGNEEPPVQMTPFEWRSGEWWFLELLVVKAGDEGAWTVEGRVWSESDERPDEAQLQYIATDGKLGGKASIIANTFSGKAIAFDDIVVKKIPQK